ncbi:MAG: polynucleotide adenylyltransferase PcnB, partial [Steroidobacterales bacterium]
RMVEQGTPESQALFLASDHVVKAEQRNVSIPKRFTLPMRELLAFQPRFRRREGRKALALLEHPRFRAAYDFLLLRCEVGLEEAAVGDWWTRIQTLPIDERQALVDVRGPEGPRSTGPRRRRRGKAAGAHTSG